jgi:hypothetical protein
LGAVFGAPAPLRVDGPEGDVGEDDDRCARAESGDVLFEPIELLPAEDTEAAGFEVHDVDEADEVDAAVVEALPAGAVGAAPVAFEEQLRVVGEDIVFAGDVKRAADYGLADNLGTGVEFFWFGEVRDVARVEEERGALGKGIDLCDRMFERADDVFVRRFVEADVAVAELDECEVGGRCGARLLAEGLRCEEAAGQGPDDAGAAQAMQLKKPRRSTPSASMVLSVVLVSRLLVVECVMVLFLVGGALRLGRAKPQAVGLSVSMGPGFIGISPGPLVISRRSCPACGDECRRSTSTRPVW